MVADNALSRLSSLVTAKIREDEVGLRDAAKASGVSASTLSRIQRGIGDTLPDTETLTKVCAWLGVPLSEVLPESKILRRAGSAPKPTTPELVAAHLRADRELSPETAKALATMFNQLYQQFTNRPGHSSR